MSAQSPQPAETDSVGTEDEFGRRGFLSRTAATGTALGGLLVAGDRVVPQFSPIGRAQAIAPAAAAAYVGVGAVAGWVVRETEIIGADDPPEGTTPETLHNEIYDALKIRGSNNQSTFIDNENIVDQMDHAAYGDGKLAGIEALNDQLTSSEVQDAAVGEAAEYVSTVMKNFLKSWNESAREIDMRVDGVAEHPDLVMRDVFRWLTANWDENPDPPEESYQLVPEPYTLPNGEEFEVMSIRLDDFNSNGDSYRQISRFDPTQTYSSESYTHCEVIHPDGGENLEVMTASEWQNVFSKMETIWNDVNDGLILWVDKIYSEVQSGEIDTEDLLTPRELAEMTASEEGVNQAIADLMALNVPVDLEREATITVEQSDAEITLKGALAPTSEPDGGMPAGETYDPETLDYDVFFNYDVSQGSGAWLAYEEGVDGGVVTFTAEPAPETQFGITTAAGEKVSVLSDDFSMDDSGSSTVWTVDISDDLDDAITSIESVEMLSPSGDTQYELIRLQQPFTIETYTDSDGNEHDNAEFTQSEPQDDTNYITQEEWDEMRRRNEELIRKYEEAKENEGIGIPSLDELAEEYGGAFAGVIIVVVAISAVVGFVTNQIPGMGD